MKKLASLFLQGLLYVVPVFVTIYVLYKAVCYADSLIYSVPILSFTKAIPGAGLLLIVILVTLIGYLGRLFITAPVSALFERLVARLPLVNMIYTSIRDLMKAFVGEKRKFDKPVLVSMDAVGVHHRLGFMTQSDLKNLGLSEMSAVYVPCAYGFMGDLMIVPSANVRPLNVNAAEMMKFVVSGGVSMGNQEAQNDEGKKGTCDGDKS